MIKKINREAIRAKMAAEKVLIEEETNEVIDDSELEALVEDTDLEDVVDEFDNSKIYFDDELEENIEDKQEYEGEDIEDLDDEETDERVEDTTEEDEEDDDMDDLFTVKKEKRKSQLKEGDYDAILEDVLAERKPAGMYGKPWVNIGLKFKIRNTHTGEDVYVMFNANKSLNPKSKLYPVVKGILGSEPADDFNLKKLKGKKANVSIEQSTDSEGNVWDNIVAVRRYISQ